MSIIKAENGNVKLEFDSSSLSFAIISDSQKWKWSDSYQPKIVTKDDKEILFSEASSIRHSTWKTGVGNGIRSSYSGFEVNGKAIPFAFDTVVWIEDVSGDIYFELIPINDEGLEVKAMYWPGYMEFDENSDKWYSVLNILQGLILPNTWENEVTKLGFDGQMCSNAAYMPWFGQVRPGSGYIAICQHPWDAAYQVDHPAKGPYCHVGMRWLPSLGKMAYRRIMKYSFLNNCNYNDLCKVYRNYVKETGLFTSLAEKAAKNPLVDKLIGSAIVHKGIKTHVSPGTYFYNAEEPEKNDHLVPFSQRTAEIKLYKEKGIEKLYLHLDGWGDPGYDNKHPDYLPACKEAGGWEGLKELSDTIKDCGYMFGLHDQYRDYYFDAPTFDREFACQAPDGSILDVSRWAGGRQSLLCATQAPLYVKRNFEEVLKHGIHLEGTYLDVFTCNEGDECDNPLHRMTRKECFEYRNACFEYLCSKNILPSSEEVTDWAMKSLVFAHYGPYDFMLQAPGSPRKGIPVPLFNLVYHDCLILPWLMDKIEGQEDYMLYALLNGGAAYMDKDGAYPNCDGSFDDATSKMQIDEKIERYRIVAKLQEKVAKCEMVKHEFINNDWKQQRTVYSDGTVVTVNFNDNSYDIKTSDEK